ncbi:MAG: hypothetical protein HZC28_05325 [Spirochaetes bacterium]|nr:hypothetical protein [Spirochaetota bacterium]
MKRENNRGEHREETMASEQEKEGFFKESDDTDEISLSETELDNILGDSEIALETIEAPAAEEHTLAPTVDDIESSPAVELDDGEPAAADVSAASAGGMLGDTTAEDETITLDDIKDVSIDLDSIPDMSDLAETADKTTDDTAEDTTAPAAEGFFKEEEDETISLSDGELENILADVSDEAGDAAAERDEALEDTVPSDRAESDESGAAGNDGDIFKLSDEDDVIALSGEELNEILEDEAEAATERASEPEPVAITPDLDIDIDEASIKDDIDDLTKKMQEMEIPEPDDVMENISAADDELPPIPDDIKLTDEPEEDLVEEVDEEKPAAGRDEAPMDLGDPLDIGDIAQLQREAKSSANVLESLSFEKEIMKESGIEVPEDEIPVIEAPEAEVDEKPALSEEPEILPDITPVIADEVPVIPVEPGEKPAKKKKADFDGTLSEDDLQGAVKEFEKENVSRPQVTPAMRKAAEDDPQLKDLLVYFDDLLANLPEEKIRTFAESKFYDLYTSLLKKFGV